MPYGKRLQAQRHGAMGTAAGVMRPTAPSERLRYDPETGDGCYMVIVSMKTAEGELVDDPMVGKRVPYKK